MKKNIKVIIIVLLIYIYPILTFSSLEDMDQLIGHFDKTLNGLSASDPMIPSLLLRLADALTKRAELKKSKRISQNCKKCKTANDDMKRALFIYRSIQNKSPLEVRGHVFFQIGYINVLLGNQKAAINAYDKIIRSNKWKDLKPKSYIALGELFYKLSKFKRAKFYFSKSLELDFPNKGFVIYRIAWCNYHLNQLKLAVEDLFKLLDSPKQFLLEDETSGTKEIDRQFHKEVARDLATFLSKKDPKNKEIERLYRLSPKDQRVENIVYLAKELIRIGNKKKAIFLLKKILPKQTQAMDKLESHVWLFQLFVETNQPRSVLEAMKAISQLWSENTCNDLKDKKCQEFKSQVSEHMALWRNGNKSDLSNVLKTYLFYLLIFKDDINATYQVADIAQKLQLWQVSAEKYNMAIQMQSKVIAGIDNKERKDAIKFLEMMLLGYIKTAELSKDKKQLRTSYETYLKLSQSKSQWLEVFFLKTKLLYDQEEYEKAANDFISMALMSHKEKNNSAQKIKLQAAQLAVDTFILLKDDKKLEQISLQLAKEFPDQTPYFMKVNRTSLMNQALASSKYPKRAFQILNRMNVTGMDDDEKIKYYKNKLILLGQLKRVSEEVQLVNQFLEIKNLSEEDKKFALLRKFYLAELMLDFSTMHEINKEFNLENLTADQWALRKAFFAELAQEEYIQYYQEFLKLSKDSQKKFDVALKLFEKVSDQSAFFKQYKNILLHNSDILSDTLLENYINNKNKEQAFQILKSLTNTDAGKAIWRDEFLQELGIAARGVSQHQIRIENTDSIEDDIKERLQLFGSLEKKALVGVNAKELIGQLIAFYLVKKEALRLYNDLISVAKSPQLLELLGKEYVSNLEKQAELYKEKATAIDSQLDLLFKNSQVFDKLEDYLSKASKAIQTISKSHLALLINYLPEEERPRLRSILKNITQETQKKDQKDLPSDLDIKTLQDDIRKDPFNKKRVKKLIALEEMRDNKTMVLYLKERRLVMLEN